MKIKLILLFLAAFVLRLAFVNLAHHGDLNNNISWANIAFEKGLNGFYEREDFAYSKPNQPPLYILFFTIVRASSWFLGTNMEWMVKIPGILADLGIAWLLYKYSKRWWIAAVWLVNPISWYNSAIWGQTDALVNLLGLAAVLALLNKKLVRSVIFFVLSVLYKPSLVIFAPILLFVAIKQKYHLGKWLDSVIAVLVCTFVVSVWFHPMDNLPIWLFDLYKQRILPGEIGYLTANAFNFWWLIDPGKVLDNITFFDLPARVLGFVFVGLLYLKVSYLAFKGNLSDKGIFFVLACVSLFSFLFLTRIHERYLFPFFPYATLLLTVPGMVLPYIVLSVTHLLNLYHLFWAPSIPVLEGLYSYDWFPQILALVNIATFIYLLRQVKAGKL